MNNTLKEYRKRKVTCSKFADILTEPKTKKEKEAGLLSQTAQSYLENIVAEYFYDWEHFNEETNLDDYYGYVNMAKPLQYGTSNENAAKSHYKLLYGEEIREVGFVDYKGDVEELKGWVGGTPDGEVDDNGETYNVEIKCPWNPANQIQNIINPELGILKKYKAQIQGEMFLTGRQKTKVISFDGRLKSRKLWMVVHEVERDERFINAILVPKLVNFVGHLRPIIKEFEKSVNQTK